MIYYITKFQNLVCKHITYRSFSSYSGLEKNNKPDNTLGAWVIISASATTSMGKKLVKDWNLKPEQVVTILSYQSPLEMGDKNSGNSVVFGLDKFSSRDKDSFSPTKVQVQGESFSAEVSTPEKIMLQKKHKPDLIADYIYPYINDNIFSVNRSGYSVFIDYIKFKEVHYSHPSNKLKNWIKRVIQWTIPRKLSAIVVTKGKFENVLLADFLEVLDECEFATDSILIIRPNDISSMKKIADGAVLVLSPTVSTGRWFVDINRELRLANHEGMRIFATPFVVSPSRNQFKAMTNSLTQGTYGFTYSFLNFHTIFVGSKDLSPWKKELDLITKMLNEAEDGNEKGLRFWQERKKILEAKGKGLEGKIGIAYKKSKDLLHLAPGFVYWPSNTYSSPNLETVYATVLSVFQNLRDNEISGSKLSSNIYQHCVIDPENFVRFNDSILQSCLWRCATPSELDYRRSDSLSCDMQSILKKLFMACKSERGITSLDLLMGIAIRWIKISNDSMKNILLDAERFLKEPQAIILVNHLKREFPTIAAKEKID